MARRGPRADVIPTELLALLDRHSDYRTGGIPVRKRKYINGIPVAESDARMIRRWRTGQITGVTKKSADALLQRYNLSR